jgi:hypothetical protein
MIRSISKNHKYKYLKLWNFLMGILHLVQGIIMVSLTRDNNLKQIYISLPKVNTATRSFNSVYENWYQVNLGYVIASFLFLSAVAHFITILPKIHGWYLSNLKREINLIRWYEYALSSSVMVYVIGYLCGISDGMLLFGLVAINACMNLFGASMEVHNSTLKAISSEQTVTEIIAEDDYVVSSESHRESSYRPDWTNFIYGCFAGCIPWIIMGVYFFVSLDRLGGVDSLPDRVKDTLKVVRFIFPTLFVLFNCFAINMALQYKKVGPWKEYLFGEKTYIILSLVAKSFLAWFIWGGTLR